MSVALEQFLKYLDESGILPPEALKEFLPPNAEPKDAEQLARELVRRKKLTKFQADAVYRGKGKSLGLGSYTILDQLGCGGMGQVYKARHHHMDRIVALKVLSPHAMKDPAAAARFDREVKAASKLVHPNIVAAFDAGQAGKLHFLVMEYVEGSDLAALVKSNGRLSVGRSVDYILQAAKGLEAAHAQRIVHRDVKPSNLLLDKTGTVKILDMGLARFDAGNVEQAAAMTATGAVMGTVDYMAPEQAMGAKQVDARADIYSLGCSLFYLLTGQATHDGDTLTARLLAHQVQPAPSLRSLRPDAPPRLDAVFQKMVATRADDRYPSMTAVIADLDKCVRGTDLPIEDSRAVATTSGTTARLAKKPVVKETFAHSTKAIGAIFGTIIAPIIVAVLIKWLERGDAAPTAPAPAAGAAAASGDGSSDGAPAELPRRGTAIRLFNQRDLTGFNTFLGSPKKGVSPFGKNKDPDKVFTVRNGELRISGQHHGALMTKKDYENYHLIVEFRWGEEQWSSNKGKARNSGILLHCAGHDAAFNVQSAIGCQIMEGRTGDIVLYSGKDLPPVSLSVEAEKLVFTVDKNQRTWFICRPGEPLTTFSSGAINRIGSTTDWRDVTGFDRKGDVERPAGEWNRMECTCQADRLTIRLNGEVVNAASNVTPRKGKIALTSEGAEILFRTVDLQPIASN